MVPEREGGESEVAHGLGPGVEPVELVETQMALPPGSQRLRRRRQVQLVGQGEPVHRNDLPHGRFRRRRVLSDEPQVRRPIAVAAAAVAGVVPLLARPQGEGAVEEGSH